MLWPHKLRGRVNLPGNFLQVPSLRTVANDNQARFWFWHHSTGAQQRFQPFTGLQPPHEENSQAVLGFRSLVRQIRGRRQNGVMRHNYLFGWETERGILLRAALAVGDQSIEPAEEMTPSILAKSTYKSGGTRGPNPQPRTGRPRSRIQLTAGGVDI